MSSIIYDPKSLTADLSNAILSSETFNSTRVALLTTRDRDYALSVLREVSKRLNRSLYLFTVAGRRRYNHDQLRWDTIGGQEDSVSLLQSASELSTGGIVVFEDCVSFLSDNNGDLRMRMLLAQMLSSENKNKGLVLVFMEPPERANLIPSILADQFIRLDIPYPRAVELESIAREEISLVAHRANISMDVERIKKEAERLASGVVGLTRSAARDALRDALAPNIHDFDSAFATLQQRKSSQLRRELAMNVLGDSSDVEDPIGLDYLVDYLRIRIDKMRVIGADRAKGILLIGPPGTGKTMLARMIGRIVNLPVVEFKISSLMNSLLGETERRFSQAFATLEAMAPNVVFIDEVEKAFGDSSERDGGTMMRCTGSLLSWLSDNPYPNFIVATSNSLKRMGEIGLTMTRSERFDAAFFVDVPSKESRGKMLIRWIPKDMQNRDELANDLAELTEKFSGADLRSVVKQATALAEYRQTSISVDMLKSEIDRKRIKAIAIYDEFTELRRWGRMFCDPAGPTDQ